MNTAQRAFSAGEVSPSLFGRVNTQRFHEGLRTCRNFIIQQDGGLVNRPGTIFLGAIKNESAQGRLLKFVNDTTRFLIEMGDGFIRFYKNHALVTVSGPPAWSSLNVAYTVGFIVSVGGNNYECLIAHTTGNSFGPDPDSVTQPPTGSAWTSYWRITTAGSPPGWATATAYVAGDVVDHLGIKFYCFLSHTSLAGTDEPGVDAGAVNKWYTLAGAPPVFEMPTPYATADLPQIQYSQTLNVIRMVCPGKPVYELTYTSDTRWVLAALALAPTILGPASAALSGGSAGATIYYAVTAVKDGTFEESLVTVVSAANRIPSAGTPTVVTFDGVVGAISYNIYRSEDGQSYGYVGSVGGVPTATSDTAWTDTNEVATVAVTNSSAPAAGALLNTLAIPANSGNGMYTIRFRGTLVAAAGSAADKLTKGYVALYYSINGGVDVLIGVSAILDQMYGAGTYGPIAHTVSAYIPGVSATDTLVIKIKPWVISNPSGAGNWTYTIDSSAAPDNSISWYQGPTPFSDKGYLPNFSVSPPATIITFGLTADYPSVIGQYQQRLLLAGTPNGKDIIWASRVGSPGNFAYSTPLLDSDPLFFQLAGRQANPIKHLVDLGQLVVFTAAAELVVEGDQSGIIKPDAVNVRQHSYNGASRLTPLVINNRALYVQARGSYVRSLHPQDTEGSINTNLSVYASHLFRGKTLLDWDFAAYPNSIVWCVRSDGTLLGLTFIPEFNVWGWHRHDTDGIFENVCCLPTLTGDIEEDVAYFIVKRTINGATHRYIEYLPTRYGTGLYATSPYSDCAKLVSFVAGVAGGLSHLEAKSISFLQDDGTVRASPNNPGYALVTVAAGNAAYGGGGFGGSGWVGLPFTSDAETLDIDTDEQGTLKHGKMKISDVAILLDNTKQLYVGDPDSPTGGNFLNGMQSLDTVQDPLTDTATRTGIRKTVPINSWNRHGRLLIRQVDPLPTTILMVSPEFMEPE